MITPVGPPEPGDFPRKKGLFHRIFRFFYIASGALYFGRVFMFIPGRGLKKSFDAMTADPENGPAHYVPPAGIPEADLTEAERKLAAEQMPWHEDNVRKA